ncbi:MAG: M28 family peptidase [Bacteroidales bacterium]|nr:M28 family peptidase [Bacteroidota bacterium]MBL6949852.1 M28 family peptidase [Bacteroidales bacterium]
MKTRTIIATLVFILFWGCNQTPRDKTSTKMSATDIAIKIPQFNADSAFNFVKAQTDFGPRVNNTKAHQKCASYLIDKLKEYSPDVVTQTGIVTAYNGTPLQFQNIIASFGHDGNNRIILGAHWDSRPYADHDPDETKHNIAIDGANDGASGVGVLLEIARQMKQTPPPIGVDIIFFDAEDYGPPQDLQDNQNTGEHWGLGSQYWAANPHKTDYFAKYGILLDMVGASGATFLMEGVSMEYAPSIVKKVWDIGNQIGYSSYFLYQRGGFVTDDHYYVIRDQGIPMIDVIHLNQDTESGMYEHWHTVEDNINKIDRNTLKAVGQTMLTVIYSEK